NCYFLFSYSLPTRRSSDLQILGQVRRAFEFSRSAKYASANLSLVFDRALKAGSKVRTVTGINKGNVSIASVAVNIAEEYFDDLKDRKSTRLNSSHVKISYA